MSDVDKYRDISRYRSTNNKKNQINLGSTKDRPSNRLTDNWSSKNDEYNSASQYSRNTGYKYSTKHIKRKKRKRKRKNIFRAVVAACILAIIGIGVYKFFPIKVNINDKELTLTYDKSLNEAIAQSGIEVKPGNFIAVDYSIINEGKGRSFTAEINGKKTYDGNYKLWNGDNIKYMNGEDIMEDYTSDDTDIPAKAKIEGVGSVHKFIGNGEPGTWSKLRGSVSGKYAERQTKDPSDVTLHNYNINPGKDKVIALTFDDGPSPDYTQQILDLLKKYNAKATFFVIGENLEEDWGKKLLKREDEAGHQVCTHTYDHGRAAGGTDITNMSTEQQIQEVTKGQTAIAKVLGKDANKVCRLPGGNDSPVTAKVIAKYVTAEIGWNIDTGDWRKPGANKVLSAMKQATSGDIILCHDGGGDRDNTVEALKDFLQIYTDKGYKFITVDEMMQYPEAQQRKN